MSCVNSSCRTPPAFLIISSSSACITVRPLQVCALSTRVNKDTHPTRGCVVSYVCHIMAGKHLSPVQAEKVELLYCSSFPIHQMVVCSVCLLICSATAFPCSSKTMNPPGSVVELRDYSFVSIADHCHTCHKTNRSFGAILLLSNKSPQGSESSLFCSVVKKKSKQSFVCSPRSDSAVDEWFIIS